MSRSTRFLCLFSVAIAITSLTFGNSADTSDLRKEREAAQEKGALAIVEQTLSAAKI